MRARVLGIVVTAALTLAGSVLAQAVPASAVPTGGTPAPAARSGRTPASAVPTGGTPSPASTADLPAHALVGYLHASFANGSGYLPIGQVSDSWDVIDLAFGEASSPTSGQISFTRCPASECPNRESDADFLAGIDAKRAAGKKVLLSIGGANGEVRLTTTAARDAFVDSVSAIIDRWHLDGVDLDFENQSLSLNAGDDDVTNPTTPAIVNLIAAVRTLKARYGNGFVLTAAPETFFVQLGYQFYGPGPNGTSDPRSGAWLPVLYALRDDLTLLTVQDYNSGPIMGLDDQYHTMGGADFHIAMTDMLLAGFPVADGAHHAFPPLRPDQVAIGAPADPYAGNGYVPPATLDQALDCLTRGSSCGSYQPRGGAHADLRGLMTWSINWDAYSGNEFADNFDSYFG
jgi:chitinase